jgi:hypothetical protein
MYSQCIKTWHHPIPPNHLQNFLNHSIKSYPSERKPTRDKKTVSTIIWQVKSSAFHFALKFAFFLDFFSHA